MIKSMKSNILLVGLDYKYIKSVATQLSGIFDMHYLDIKDLIAYNLIDEQNVLDTAGIEYYKSQVHKIVLSACDYENTIINIPYDLFLKDAIANELNKTSMSIFINIDKQTLIKNNENVTEENKNTLAIIAYDEYCLLLNQKTNLQIDADNNIKNTVEKILDLLKNINISELQWI